MPTDKKLNQLIINKLTAEQYAGIESPDPEQLYFVPDETEESLPPQAPEDKGKALLANGDGTASWKGVANAESANDWKEPQTFSGGAVADEIKSKSTGNSMLKTQKNTSGAWTVSVGSPARPTKVEGTEVDLAGALKANNNGDVEVLKNLNVDGNATFSGKSSFIWHGTITETFEGMTVTSNVNGFFFHAPIMTSNGEPISDPGILALTSTENTDGLDFYIINPKHYDPATQETRPATVEEILSGDWSFYMSVESTDKLIKNGDNAKLKALDVNRMNCSGSNPTIDDLFKVANENNTLGEIAQFAKRNKYQHTVHITALSDTDKQLNVSFTERSSKGTPINSYQALHEVFGGRNLTVSGNMKYYSMQVPLYLDLHGGTIATDKIYCSSAESVGAYQQPTLSDFPNITFTDDVCIPN